MSELDSEARALLRASKGGDRPSAAQRERVRRKLMIAIGGAGAAASMSHVAHAHAAGGALKLGASASTKLIVSMLVAAAATSGVVVWSRSGVQERAPITEQPPGAALPAPSMPTTTATATPEPTVVVPATREPSVQPPHARKVNSFARAHASNRTRAEAPAETPSLADAPSDEQTADPFAPAATIQPPVAMQSPAPAPPPDVLSRELVLISQAQRAVHAGQSERALALLARHAAQFPAGALTQERFATQALAFCALGRVGEGLRAIDQLAQLSPSSPLLGSARRSCAAARAVEAR